MKTTTKTILGKKGKDKVAMITAYDAIFARLADAAGADIILVGDSLGNVVLGFDSTIPVTLEMMIHHTSAVARTKPDALLLADLPFACAHFSFDKLLADCRRLLQEGGAEAVKIEGDASIADKVAGLVKAGVAVMGHIGLEPQQFLKLGGYRKFGKTEAEKNKLVADAKALEKAGVFAILLEMTDAETTREISKAVSVPVIGIGSGADCDGQVLVCADILGLSENTPPFAKKFADAKALISDAYARYIAEVKDGKFPEKK